MFSGSMNSVSGSSDVGTLSGKRKWCSLTSPYTKKWHQRTLSSFMDDLLTPNEEHVLCQRMIKMLADNGISFN